MQLEQASSEVGSIQDARRDLYRQQILAAAELEFSRAGFADTKMSAIAQMAGLSLATVYKNFSGKNEIWDDLHAERMKDLLADVEAATKDVHGAIDRLVSGVATVATFLMSHDSYLEMNIHAGTGWASSSDLAVGVQKSVWSAGLDMISDGITAAETTGELRQIRPTIAAGLIVSSLQVWMIDWVNTGRSRAPSVIVDELTNYLRSTLANT